MKRVIRLPLIVLALVLAFTLASCKKKTILDDVVVKPVEEPIEKVEEEEKVNIIKQFDSVVSNNKNDPDKIIAFINENIKKLTQLEGDRMIDALEKSLESNVESVTNMILDLDKDGELLKIAGSDFNFPEEKVAEIKDKKLKDEVTKALKNMYKLINVEGQLQPIIDYNKLKTYNNEITDEWKSYLAIRAMDSDNVPFVDGGIRISFDNLADRIIKTEQYLNNYIDSSRQEEMLYLYENKLTAYMKGFPNTPISDPQTGRIYDNVMQSYDQTSKIEGFITPTIIYHYMEAIIDNKGIIDNGINKIAEDLIAEAVEIMREYK